MMLCLIVLVSQLKKKMKMKSLMSYVSFCSHLHCHLSILPSSILSQSSGTSSFLGTTRGQAGGAEQFVQVEVGLTKIANAIAKESKILHVSVVSAQGANKDMWVPSTLIHPLLYIRTLGEKQQSVIDSKFPSTTIFQPGMLNRLVGDRAMENIFVNLLPSLRVDLLAEAMVLDAEVKLQLLFSKKKECQESESQNEMEPIVTFYEGNGAITNLVTNRSAA